jgi:succinyl-diaminopimelate desuccinylase
VISLEDLDFFKKLISVKSLCTTKEGYEQAARLIEQKLESIGLSPAIYDGREGAEDRLPRPNVVAEIDFGQEKTLLLNAHYDVVPAGEGWHYDPFTPTQVGDSVYARGASDDKSGIATIIWAVEELGEKSKRNILLTFTCDEEVGGARGLGYLMNDVGLAADEALILDGGHDAIYVGASGIINGNIVVRGIQGHAGYPHQAKNPIYPLSKTTLILEDFGRLRGRRLSRFRSPPDSPISNVWGRFSITMLRSGERSNIIPGEAEASFDLRLIPEEEKNSAIAELEETIAKISSDIGWKIDLEKIEGGGNYFTNTEDPFVIGFTKLASEITGQSLEFAAGLGGADGRYTHHKGIPTLVFGPSGSDSRDHGIDEYISLTDMRMVKDILLKYLEEENSTA